MRTFAIGFLFAAAACAGMLDRTYQIDTSSVSGAAGLVSIQFNPGFDSGPATAQLTEFNGFGAVLGFPLYTGEAIGSLGTTVILNNGEPLNEVQQPITFGSAFRFRLMLDWMDSGVTGSTFSISFLVGGMPVLTDDPTGAAMLVDIFPDGSSFETLGPFVAGPEVPEPTTAALALAGLGALAIVRRRG